MARSIIQHIPIDAEWAETLVGLRLNIPNRWWPGYDDGGLNRGHIAAIDFNASNTFYFQVELNDEPGAHYAMRYDSVVLYADEEQRGFSPYHLPSRCPGNPDDEIARVPVPKKYIGWMVDDDYTDQEDVAIDEAIEFDKNEDNDHDDADADDADADDADDNDDDDDVYSEEVTTKKKRKKERCQSRRRRGRGRQRRRPNATKKAGTTHQSTVIML
jgi:hypothetical protein